MRVIAGKYKRKNLKVVPGNRTRPTTDRNKENMFNLIGPYFSGGCCLDLFAGSGGLGIEALSRGMTELYSVDSSYQAYQTIRENVLSLRLEPNQVHVYKTSCFKALSLFQENDIQFDLVLLDPPYGKNFIPKIMPLLLPLLKPRAMVVIEESSEVSLAENYEKLKKSKTVSYGITSLHIYQMEVAA